MRLQLPTNLTIATVDGLRTSLLEVVNSAQALELDASEVTQIDTAGLQVLCAVVAQRRKGGLALSWLGRETIDPMISIAGLNHEFESEKG